jgi:hypothetical protein
VLGEGRDAQVTQGGFEIANRLQLRFEAVHDRLDPLLRNPLEPAVASSSGSNRDEPVPRLGSQIWRFWRTKER